MTSDLNIYRSAKVLIDQHGKGAHEEAERRAESLAVKREAAGAAVWKPIATALQEIQRTAPPAGTAAS